MSKQNTLFVLLFTDIKNSIVKHKRSRVGKGRKRMAVFTQVFFILIGVLMLVKGASYFVEGAAGIARRLRISEVVIGVMFVAYGTSVPEFAVSFRAITSGGTQIALGNILGSNILNVLGILGMMACIKPIKVGLHTAWLEIPFLLAITAMIEFVGVYQGYLDSVVGMVCIGLLLLFTIHSVQYLHMTSEENITGALEQIEQTDEIKKPKEENQNEEIEKPKKENQTEDKEKAKEENQKEQKEKPKEENRNEEIEKPKKENQTEDKGKAKEENQKEQKEKPKEENRNKQIKKPKEENQTEQIEKTKKVKIKKQETTKEEEKELLEEIEGLKEFEEIDGKKQGKLLKEIGLILFGLFVIAAGSDVTVDAATRLALRLQLSERVIGLTVVAFGTLFPELLLTMSARKKGKDQIIMGTIMGSNIVNILFILGITCILTPLEYPIQFITDGTTAMVSVLILMVGVSGKKRLGRVTGVLMLMCYVAYLLFILGFII